MRNKLKKLFIFLKSPNLIVLCVNWALTLLAIAGSIYLALSNFTGVWAIVVYVLSATSLAYSVYTAVLFAPTLRRRFSTAIKARKFTKTLVEDYGFRTMLFATVSLVINLGFVVFNAVFAILYTSLWYSATASYYFLLSGLKAWVFYAEKGVKKTKADNKALYLARLKNYRACGIFLLVLEASMTAVVSLTVMQNKSMKSTEVMAIATAAYTFYKIIFAVINVAKAKKHDNPPVQAVRNIGLVDALITVVSLQMTLTATFSTSANDLAVLNGITGFAACAIAVFIGGRMIVRKP